MLTKRSSVKFFLLLAFCAASLLAAVSPIQAQSSLNLRMETLDLSQFPKITLFLDAYDSQGKFIPGMDLDHFSVFEDGYQRTLNEVQELEPGLHTIIAFNLGATLSNRQNATLPTRYEETVYSLATWLNGIQSTAANQYSLVSNEGILVEKSQEKTSFTNILQNYKPNLFNFEPSLESLSSSLEIAAKPSLIAQSKPAILYITPLPLDQDLAKIASIQARAQEIGVPVNVWLVAPETASNAPALQYLNQLATATGGKFLFYMEGSAAPDAEEYVGRMRNIYRLRYTSAVNQSGDHTIRVTSVFGNLSAETPEMQFSIDLNLPTAVLTNLPPEIRRAYSESADGSGKMLQPAVITLQAAITFPDGYERQLKASRLYADGEMVVENTEEPFDYFGWQLEEYQYSGEHLLAVEVEDILGFRNISPPAAVMILVASPYPDWLTGILKFVNQGGWIPLSIIAAGGSLYAGLRLRKRWLARRKEAGDIFEGEAALQDPMLQSVPGLGSVVDTDYLSMQSRENNAPGSNQETAPALLWAGKEAPPADLREIYLEKPEIILGSDAAQCGVVLPPSAASPQHAKLMRNERGSVSIADLDSETGTWVNFAPVSKAGVLLHQGDLIQIGSLTFRYRIGSISQG